MSTEHEDKIDLLPCPFCGCVDAHLTIRDDGLDAVMCDDCTAEGPAFNDRASAASGWNRRAVVSKAQEPAVKAGTFDLNDLADACVDAEISDSKYESLCIALQAKETTHV